MGIYLHTIITTIIINIMTSAFFPSIILCDEKCKNVVCVPVDCPTLQEACRIIVPGGTIVLKNGTYALDECISLDKPCTITGETDNRSRVIIESSGKGVFNVNIAKAEKQPAVTLRSLTLVTSAHKEWPLASTCSSNSVS